MLRAAIAFIVLALTAFLLSATDLAGFSFAIGRILLIAVGFFALVGVAIGLVGSGRSDHTSADAM